MEDRVKKELIDIVGEKNYTDGLIDLVSYSYDASEYHHRPDCGVWPESAEQISEIMKLANRENLAVTPRGGATGLTGMAVPVRGGIILDLNHMNKILNISIEDRFAVVQGGESIRIFLSSRSSQRQGIDPWGKCGHQCRRCKRRQVRNHS